MNLQRVLHWTILDNFQDIKEIHYSQSVITVIVITITGYNIFINGDRRHSKLLVRDYSRLRQTICIHRGRAHLFS